MNKEQINQKVKEIINDISYPDNHNINDDSNFKDDLGIDSLDIVTLIMKIEYEFNICIHDKEIDDIKTFKDLINIINSRKL